MLHCQSPASPEHQPRARAEDDLPATLLESPVLIVEDEAMIAWTVESLLEELGFTRIAIAASGETAIAEAARVAPQLIVSDINLGPARMDGVAAAIEMVARAAAAVVFVTGHASASAATVEDSLNAPQGPTGPSPFRRTGRFVASQ
jgi:CheY-like chemotaxis protein